MWVAPLHELGLQTRSRGKSELSLVPGFASSSFLALGAKDPDASHPCHCASNTMMDSPLKL